MKNKNLNSLNKINQYNNEFAPIPKPIKKPMEIKPKYNRTKIELINQANERFKNDETLKELYKDKIDNFDFRQDYNLPKNFSFEKYMDYSKLDFFNTKDEIQEFAMPFTNEQFQEFMHMPKIAVGTASKKFIHMRNGSGISMFYSQFMIGTDKNGKDCLFKFNVNVDEHDSSKINISLDMCVAGCKWIHLCRYDSFETENSEGHKNWIVNGELTRNYEIVRAPHFHTQSEQCQVYFSDKLSYTTAEFSNTLNNVKQNDPYNHFNSALKLFSENFGINTALSNLAKDYYQKTQENKLNTFLHYNDIFSVEEKNNEIKTLEEFKEKNNNLNKNSSKSNNQEKGGRSL